ncbi:hypothetical protein FRB97_005849 [Tulasnella sp. 331]|nr:hypothetical protein FRB97_005849 [Tulasnella sp. 331]
MATTQVQPPPEQTTITVTSFYLSPTASSSSPSSGNSSGGGGGSSKHFAALASGAAVGGFALTCIIGWFLFQLWKKRHPQKWHGRTDAENFPGWRRVTAQRLSEAKSGDVTDGSTRDVTEKNSENGYSKSEDLSQSSGFGFPVLPISARRPPLPAVPPPPTSPKLMYRRASSLVSHTSNTPNLMQEYAAALAFESGMHRAESQLSHESRRSLSPGSDITPDVIACGVEKQRQLGFPNVDVETAAAAEIERDLMIGSESSHSHSQHTHYSHNSYHYQRPTSAIPETYGLTQQPKPKSRAPSPAFKNRRSTSQQSVTQIQLGSSSNSVNGPVTGIAAPPGRTSSSWHGHTMFTPGSHATWSGYPSAIAPALPLPYNQIQNQNQPPTAWNSGGLGQRRASSSSIQPMQMHSPPLPLPPQPYFIADKTVAPEVEYGRLQQPRRGSTQSTPPMFFIPQTADHSSAPPSPHEPPKRRLTCTNPDETKSLTPSKPSRPSTPEPEGL